MSELVVTAFGDVMDNVLAKITENVEGDKDILIEAVSVVGSVKVNGQWTDFGIRIPEKQNGLQQIDTFVSVGDGAYAESIENNIRTYFDNVVKVVSPE